MSRRVLLIGVKIVTPLAVLAIVWVWSAGAESYYYPRLRDVLTAFKDIWLFDRFGADVLASLARLAIGYGIAVLLGVSLGVLLGLQPALRRMATPVVEFLRAIPPIFAGMRTSLSLSLILMVISEMVASSNGIGYFILQSPRSLAITQMWSGIILLGVLGYLLNAAFTVVERRVLAWHVGARSRAR
jgi:ABC-type nitrate/sulfonate/bicarbonate transport system permease component